jgi:hypothetical protein
VGKLPGARHAEHDELDQDPPDHARVGALGLVAELGFAFLLFRIGQFLGLPNPSIGERIK